MSTDSGDAAVAATASGLRYLFLLNVASKLVTFGANAFLVRHTTPVEQGVKLNMELLVSSVLFFSREALRGAALRLDMSDVEKAPAAARAAYVHTLNLASVSVALTVALALSCAGAAGHLVGAREEWAGLSDSLQLPLVLYLHLAGLVLEAVGEPFYMAAQGMTLLKLRSTAEAVALVARVAAAYLLVLAGQPPLVAIGASQVAYGAAQTAVYVWYFAVRLPAAAAAVAKDVRVFFPGRRADGEWAVAPAAIVSVAGQLQLEAVMRLVLTEGEKIVLSVYAVLAQQGTYDVVVNLGSILCRLLFKFVEEFSLALWSKLIAGGAEKRAVEIFTSVARAMIDLGTFFCAFGPAYSRVLLFALYGHRWTATDAPDLLGVYCYYAAVMGVNGVGEAFFRAAASGDDLKRLWKVQSAFSATSVGLTVLSSRAGYGVRGLIVASLAVMLLRIAFCIRFAAGRPAFRPAAMLPSVWVGASTAACAVAAGYLQHTVFPEDTASEAYVGAAARQVAMGVPLVLGHVAVVFRCEREVLTTLRMLFQTRGKTE